MSIFIRDSTGLAAITFSIFCAGLQANAAEPTSAAVEFNRDIRPILSDVCFHCHGPDKTARKADLRLDIREGAFADLGGYRPIVPGNLKESVLFQRIISKDADERMPPPDSDRKLTTRQIDLIRRWILQGAKWQEHWSFITPVRPEIPTLKNTKSARNAIDHFVFSRLEREGLSPSPEAVKTTLIRRVTLDLTGLPPTPKEVSAYLADGSEKAYEKIVDRLLKSPRYGERMTLDWLDGARYADTSGYQNDGPRYMWRWRDWVIEAYNSNMPFDQFTIEQIAGDMLPNPTLKQRIATGFNRNHRGNAEGGIIPEEFAVEYVIDRVETTSTVWLGLTMGCGRCHEHKYDPISQEEFYQLFAYFNNIPESGRAIKEGNSPPLIKAPTRQQRTQLAKLNKQLNTAEKKFRGLQPKINRAQTVWEKSLSATPPVDWTITDGLVAHFKLNGNLQNSGPKEKSAKKSSDKAVAAKFVDGKLAFASGMFGQSASFDGQGFVDAGDIARFDYFDKFSLGAWVFPTDKQAGTVISKMTDTARADGYSLVIDNGKVQLNLVKRWLDDCIRVETQHAIPVNSWTHVMATYDGSRVAGGISIYFNGEPQPLDIHLDGINQTFGNDEPLRIGGGGGVKGRFRGRLDDVRVYNHRVLPEDVALIATSQSIGEIRALSHNARTNSQAAKLRRYFLETQAPIAIQQARRHLLELRSRKEQLLESLPTVMVMQEMKTPRETHLLIRGQYNKPGEKVSPGIPASLPSLPQGVPNNRLGLAKWLIDRSNPLTARVTVNRYWQMLFGNGIVKTTEDFGSQGELPTHPKLLDWLAVEYMENGWNTKALLKTLVMSGTYRQSSKVTPALVEKDPENRLLARGPRFRLSAHTVRDQALMISGLLVEKLGGPSVKPYQPAGLWKEVSGSTYKEDTGDKLYRRSLYTYWKRTVAPPTMMAFDAAGREFCEVRKVRTNTPLQALALMNDMTFVEAARVLAERMMIEGGTSPADRIGFAFRLATARNPHPNELKILVDGFKRNWNEYRRDAKSAKELIHVGASTPNAKLDVSELAAYTTTAGLILNVDEVITKE